jgi:hypothetical protein
MPPKPRRGGLRSDPLAAVIPDPAATSAPSVAQVESAPAQAPSSAPEPSSDQQAPAVEQSTAAKTPAPEKSVKFNGYVSPDHADRARDALYVLPGEWTTGRVLEHANDLALADLEQTHNGGKPFPKRPAGQGLRRGPRIT